MKLALPLVLVIACSGKKDAPAPAAAPPAPPAVATPVAKAGSGSGSGSATVALTAEERAASAAYGKAMREGRKATSAKKYADAVAAFDRALAARKGDARALGERGYARLLDGKDLDAASSDLDDAAGATKDPKILSQIWFNRGLVDEKRDQADHALVDFFLANKLRPTAAAKAKLGGKPVCPAYIERDLKPSEDEGNVIEAKSWLDLAKQTSTGGDAPASEAAAANDLTGEDTPKLPAIAIAGHAGSGRTALLVVARGKGLVAYALGQDVGGRCPGTLELEVVKAVGTRIHVHGEIQAEGGMTDMCAGSDDERVPCSGASDEEPRGEACFGGTPTERDLVVDTAKDKIVFQADRPKLAEPLAKITVELADDGVHVSGLDCARVEKL